MALFDKNVNKSELKLYRKKEKDRIFFPIPTQFLPHIIISTAARGISKSVDRVKTAREDTAVRVKTNVLVLCKVS